MWFIFLFFFFFMGASPPNTHACGGLRLDTSSQRDPVNVSDGQTEKSQTEFRLYGTRLAQLASQRLHV
jgi:hypothetical protein